jgi:hypothetical protein
LELRCSVTRRNFRKEDRIRSRDARQRWAMLSTDRLPHAKRRHWPRGRHQASPAEDSRRGGPGRVGVRMFGSINPVEATRLVPRYPGNRMQGLSSSTLCKTVPPLWRDHDSDLGPVIQPNDGCRGLASYARCQCVLLCIERHYKCRSPYFSRWMKV